MRRDPTPSDPDDPLERALRAEPLLPLPAGLAARVLEAVCPAPRIGAWGRLGRVAAAVLLLLGAWTAVAGATPALADVLPAGGVVRAVPGSLGGAASPPLVMDLPAQPVPGDSGAGLWLGLGALVLVGGLLLAWRAHRRGRDDDA